MAITMSITHHGNRLAHPFKSLRLIEQWCAVRYATVLWSLLDNGTGDNVIHSSLMRGAGNERAKR